VQISKLAKWPLWTVEIFTTAKSFESNPILGSHLLNRLGLHVFRLTLTHAMTGWRRLFVMWLVPCDERRKFREQGYIVIPNFLAAEEFQRVREEALDFSGELRRMVQGDTHTYQGLLDYETTRGMPACEAALSKSRLLNLMMYGGAAFKHSMFFVHCIKNGVRQAEADPQKQFHSDTFHPTMKAWLFLDDVDEHNGPFNYVPGSHRLTWRRLKWEYESSVSGRSLSDKYARRGSLRIGISELKKLGFSDPAVCKVPANTLVMADTTGFHRRGEAGQNSSRLAIYAYSRSNPFNPFPGVFPTWCSRIEQRLTQLHFRRADEVAAKKKVRASWHRVPNSSLVSPNSDAV
jgi:hypothetical protein